VDISDWSKGTPLIGAGWHILEDGDYRAMDGAARITTPTTRLQQLTIDIPEFTLAYPNTADHVKALMTTEEHFPIGAGFSVAVDLSARIHGTELNPFGADPDDPKLGCGSISIIDFSAGIVINFEVSNRRVITLREIFDPSAPTTVKPFLMCDPYLLEGFDIEPGSWHRYEIQYLAKEHPSTPVPDKVRWLIDGGLVREVDWLPAPGPDRVVKPSRFTVNMAIFTLLDDLPDGRGGVIGGYDPEYAHTTFGQGATVRWRNLETRNLD
jgi:hypothetical protein